MRSFPRYKLNLSSAFLPTKLIIECSQIHCHTRVIHVEAMLAFRQVLQCGKSRSYFVAEKQERQLSPDSRHRAEGNLADRAARGFVNSRWPPTAAIRRFQTIAPTPAQAIQLFLKTAAHHPTAVVRLNQMSTPGPMASTAGNTSKEPFRCHGI